MEKNILIFQEKHDDLYFTLKAETDKLRVFYKIIKEREEEGYYYPKKETAMNTIAMLKEKLATHPELAKYSSLSEAELEALPESLKNDYAKLKVKVEKNLLIEIELQEEDLAFAEMVEQIIALPVEEAIELAYTYTVKTRSGKLIEKSIPMVEHLIDLRADYQYEGYSLESSEDF